MAEEQFRVGFVGELQPQEESRTVLCSSGLGIASSVVVVVLYRLHGEAISQMVAGSF